MAVLTGECISCEGGFELGEAKDGAAGDRPGEAPSGPPMWDWWVPEVCCGCIPPASPGVILLAAEDTGVKLLAGLTMCG